MGRLCVYFRFWKVGIVKVAVLISGSPRFYAGFDSFINGIVGADSVDYYVQLWKDNPKPDKLGYDNYVLVADSWRTIDPEWAKNKISSNLPDNHQLVNLEVVDSSLIEYPTITGPQMHHSNFQSIWKMHLGWNLVDKLRQRSGNEYDLVIRARPDLCLTKKLNLIDVKNFINDNPKSVLVSNAAQHGVGYSINDVIGVSTPDNIAIYTNLINYSLIYNLKGIMFHPETLLAYHLISNGIKICPRIGAEIRLGSIEQPNNGVTVDFGCWQ